MAPSSEHPAPSDKDAIVSAPRGEGRNVIATVNCYDETGAAWNGTIVEETSAFRADVEVLRHIHPMIWDANTGQTLEARADAAASEVRYEAGTVPEIHIENEFVFGDGTTGTVEQSLVVPPDSCGLLLDTDLTFEAGHERTAYTLAAFGIEGHHHEATPPQEDGYHIEVEGADVLVIHADERFVALAQETADGDRSADGHRVGIQGRTEGSNRSAWTDVYRENDGWIDSNERASGELDAVVGNYLGEATDARYTTAIGFGHREATAVDNALGLLDRGYDEVSAEFVSDWATWHATVADPPVDDPDAAQRYELSLTSMKCAQEPHGGTIAGAFKPKDMSYRFIWPRDLVIIVQALLAADAVEDARESLDWFVEHQITEHVEDDRGIDRYGTWWQNYYATGEPHWTALQLDQVGGPIYAHWLAWQETGDDEILEEYYETSRRAAEFLLSWDNGWGFPKKHQDPWEEVWGHSTEGSAAGIAGLRCMSELASATGDEEFADRCREQADIWAEHFDQYCLKDTVIGRAYVTADKPEAHADPMPDNRPDAAAFMATWPWNVVDADHEPMVQTSKLVDHPAWRADGSLVVGRYPGDRYTPSGEVEDGGWPLCEAYADVVAAENGVRDDAVELHVFDHVEDWTTEAGLLPERVDDIGHVRWNSNLQWSQAMYVLLAESLDRGEPYGLAPE